MSKKSKKAKFKTLDIVYVRWEDVESEPGIILHHSKLEAVVFFPDRKPENPEMDCVLFENHGQYDKVPLDMPYPSNAVKHVVAAYGEALEVDFCLARCPACGAHGGKLAGHRCGNRRSILDLKKTA